MNRCMSLPNPLSPALTQALQEACGNLLKAQTADGYWWYTLEANESIGAGTILLMHYADHVDTALQEGLKNRILSEQNKDGSWSLYHGGPGNLAAAVECYFALKLAGVSVESDAMKRARHFILTQGGAERSRAFTRIHLALFGLVPWSACPAMPVWFGPFPAWFPISIYEFSSWARASIVPLLIVMTQKKVRALNINVDEIFSAAPSKRDYSFPSTKLFSLERFFIVLDWILKKLESFKYHPGRDRALQFCDQWTCEHIERTEDIWPAMVYAIYARLSLDHPWNDATIQKAWSGLTRFQQCGLGQTHQQCCISPVWDTPWAGMALLEAGEAPNSPALLKAGRWLISKQILDFYGDWAQKNRKGKPGGWAFEFQNDFFPDVDDTIEVLFLLKRLEIPSAEKKMAIDRGLAWLLSMQSSNGGWAAFDKNNTQEWVNRIPFSDHGACLDPPTPDITGRMLELLSVFGRNQQDPVVRRALRFIQKTQESWGPWWGRWGVNYIYGTWCVLQGLAAIGEDLNQDSIRRAVTWLKSIQNTDGGWGEDCKGYLEKRYVPLNESVPSQTAWALMGLIAAGEEDCPVVKRGIDYLLRTQNAEGSWDEPQFTGTGFPGHFYIRYHGYRSYFPTLALGKYAKALK